MAKEYKDTLLMPKTGFEMRGNLGVRELEFQAKWEELDLYNKVLEKNKDKTPFVLHDGPPYANGNIHIGHALNKTLKDFVIRYKNMSGFKAPYVPGWDTHGLPIETAVTKTGVNRKTMSVTDFRGLCHKYALEQVNKQRSDFKRLGVLGTFEDPYLTLDRYFEAEQIRVFAKMAEKGLIYKGLKPVYWSPSSESALAEAEIEYFDKKDASIFIAFPVVDGKGLIPNDAFMAVWTTTPWTIPANLAICAGPDIVYVLAKCDKRLLVFAKDLKDTLKEEFGIENVEIIKEFKGNDMLGITYKHPIFDRISPMIVGEHVTTTDGTGLVHTAPGHGEDDFNVGKLFNLEVLCPVDERGYMMDTAYEFKGMTYEECNKAVVEKLEQLGLLLKLKWITHSYPHDWRTKKPIIFRATPQWFASIDKLKDELLDEIKKVTWYPKWGELRISNMIKDRKDWCISRQRAWGVPIPIFYAEDGTEILDQKVFSHIAMLFEKYGSDIWFDKTAAELLPEGYKNEHSPNGVFRKETDIMDVWFDSGSSHQAVLKHYNLPYPADLYLEGADQYRGWFNSSLITGVAVTQKAPYKAVVTHGFTLDGEGRKMSKSLGNTIDPLKVIKQMGADILRMWVSSVEYMSDQRISDEMLKQVSESYRKVRNTFKFILGNISDLKEECLVKYEDMPNVDKYMMIKLNELNKTVIQAYENYQFNEVYRLMNNFIATLLSPFYLDFTKDILYIHEENSKERRSVQTVLYHTIKDMIRLLTPIIPHTATESYDYLPFRKLADAYLEDMPKIKEYNDSKLQKNFDEFMNVRNEILKSLENARNEKVIGKSFNAKLIITPNQELFDLFEAIDSNIGQMCIVSQFELKPIAKEIKIEVEAAKGQTCARCWQIVPMINEEELCPRCAKIVK